MKPLRSVLVVDDDPDMAASTSALLCQLGLEVFSVQSAIEALDIVELWTVKIDLLITDLLLTPMNGIELVQKVRQFRPQIKVIYMSAAPGADRMTLTEDPSSPLLQKPFTMRELEVTLRTVWADTAEPEKARITQVCPNCGSEKVRLSKRRFLEWPLLPLVNAYRCGDCRHRFFRLRVIGKIISRR